MSIWEAFGKGRYKGFSREAGLLLDEAVELAGGLGCKKADTGHLLLAMLQTDHGPWPLNGQIAVYPEKWLLPRPIYMKNSGLSYR